MSAANGAGAAARRLLVLGHIGAQFSLPKSPDAGLVLVELPDGEPAPRTVEVLDGPATATRRITLLSAAGRPLDEARPDDPVPTWQGPVVAPEFRRHLHDTDAFARLDLEPGSLAPLLLLRTWRAHGRDVTEVLVASRLRSSGCLFVRVARLDGDPDTPVGELVVRALGASTALTESVRMESLVYVKFEQGTEIEAKIGVTGEVSNWAVATDLFTRIDAGELPGFMPEFANEFQRWQMAVQLFEVLAPPEAAGHISFSPESGSYVVSRKLFRADGSRRRTESTYLGVTVPDDDIAGYLATAYPDLVVRALPPYTRVRFDINVESTRTGHIYGVAVDRVTVDGSGETLRQVEVEYLRSRVHDGLDRDTVDPEMDRLTGLIQEELTRIGVANEQTDVSKLSFLRGCAGPAAPRERVHRGG
jgi:hypothetical protein